MENNKQNPIRDLTLYQAYMEGFNDELYSRQTPENMPNDIIAKAYRLGRDHAIMGDDISSVDNKTWGKIINEINNMV